MKCLRILLVSVLAGLAALGAPSTQAEQPLVRLTTGSWPPYTSQDAPGGGMTAQIVREAFENVGVRVELGFFPWPRALKLARDGAWDGSLAWFETPERRADFHFSAPIATARTGFFHLRETDFRWENYDDLKRFRVGGTVAYSYGDDFDAAEAAGAFETRRAKNDEAGLKNLVRGRIDVFPGEVLVTYEQLNAFFPPEVASRVTHHSRLIDEQSLHLMLSRQADGTEALIARFERGLEMLVASGRHAEILGATQASDPDRKR